MFFFYHLGRTHKSFDITQTSYEERSSSNQTFTCQISRRLDYETNQNFGRNSKFVIGFKSLVESATGMFSFENAWIFCFTNVQII